MRGFPTLSVKVLLVVLLLFSFSMLLSGEEEALGGANRESAVLSDVEDYEYDLTPEGAVIEEYIGEETKIEIPGEIEGEPVVKLDENSFMDKGLEEVIIPNSVEEIGDRAFLANELNEVTIPEGVEEIGVWAFKDNNLEEVTIPDLDAEQGDDIESEAFALNELTKITIAEDISISIVAFERNPGHFVDDYEDMNRQAGTYEYCDDANVWELTDEAQEDYEYTLTPDGVVIDEYIGKKTKIEIPGEIEGEPVVKLGGASFEREDLEEVTIPDSVEVIGSYAFFVNDLTEVTIPDSVEEIGIFAFSTNDLTEIIIPDSVEEIGSSAFTYNDLTEVTIPDGLEEIGHGVFASNHLTEVTIPDSVEVIGDDAFQYNQLSKVNIGDSVEVIGDRAFGARECENELTEVTIPSSVEEIEDGAFLNNMLTEITIGNDVSIEDDAFDGNPGDFVTDYGNENKRAGTYEYCVDADLWILKFKVELSVNPEESGKVEGAGTYDEGEEVTIEAHPADGFDFINWAEDGEEVSTNTQYTFDIEEDRELVANFELKEIALEAERLAGDDRYDTAIEVSRKAFPESAEAVVLARGDDFPDALSGVPLAYEEGGPLLLTPSGSLHEETATEIDRLLTDGDTVYVLGGTTAISDEVEDELEDKGYEVERLEGANRYDTAVAIADELTEAPQEAFLTTGEDFPDAVAASGAAAGVGAPILLTPPESLSGDTADYLEEHDLDEIHVIGGEVAVSQEVKEEAGSDSRIAGVNRWDTSVEVAEEFFDAPEHVAIATGWAFPDALSGGVYAAQENAPLLLTEEDTIPGEVRGYLAEEEALQEATVLGGEAAVAEDVLEELE